MKYLLLVVVCIGLLGCEANSFSPSKKLTNPLVHDEILSARYCIVNNAYRFGVDSWLCFPSDELANRLFHHEIPFAQYCVVNDAEQQEAIHKLQRYAIIELTNRAAKHYTLPCNIELKGHIYLVRALDVSGHDQFTVYGHHGNLYVTSGVLGTSASPRRTALVLSTKFAVSKVYVSYFVAE